MQSMAPDQNKHRKKRLRKKLRVGEFREFGFLVQFQFSPDSPETDEVLELWLQFVEQQQWIFSGVGVRGQLTGFVEKSPRGTLNEADRQRTQQWLNSQKWCSNPQVGRLQDAWYENKQV